MVAASGGSKGERLASIDWLRGLVMVLMALDHARDYFGDIRLDPVDLGTTTPALFFTRWITHFCAPVFVFLAGTSAYLFGARRTRGELATFLLTRGLWLVVIEFTVVTYGWIGTLTLGFHLFQVIAAIGVAMIALAGLVLLPYRAVLGVGLAIVLGHNALDGLRPEDFGGSGWLWILLHDGGPADGIIPMGEGRWLLVIYPLLPWIGVMALGYAFGPVVRREAAERRRVVLRLGIALCVAFLVLRGSNLYGDPVPWTEQESPTYTVLSFLNCEKYPPSLAFLLMTLGPAFVLLAWMDRRHGPLGRALVVFGRVPFFYYVAHIFLIHYGSRLFYTVTLGQDLSVVRHAFSGQPYPEGYGRGLVTVYASWILVVLLLYPVCRWFAGVKARSSSRIMSYL